MFIKIKGSINKETDNYLDGKYFVFNDFKVAKFKSAEEKRVEIPAELKKMIDKWKKINPTDFLIFNPKSNEPLNSSQYGKILNKIYGEKVSVDVIRSVFLTDLYKGLPKVAELEQIANDMGHSVNAQLNYYVKKDD